LAIPDSVTRITVFDVGGGYAGSVNQRMPGCATIWKEKELERERIRTATDAGYLSPPWYFDIEVDAPPIVPEPREQDPLKLMVNM
jgi:hypothetical protein